MQHVLISNAPSALRENTLADFSNDIPRGLYSDAGEIEIALEAIAFDNNIEGRPPVHIHIYEADFAAQGVHVHKERPERDDDESDDTDNDTDSGSDADVTLSTSIVNGFQSAPPTNLEKWKVIKIQCAEIGQVMVGEQYDRTMHILRVPQLSGYFFHEFKKKRYDRIAVQQLSSLHIQLTSLDNEILPLEAGQPTIARIHIRPVMESGSFIVRIKSDDSNQKFPSNTQSDFTSSLAKPLEFNEKWSVSLAGVTHPPTKQIVVPDAYSMRVLTKKRQIARNKRHRRSLQVAAGASYAEVLKKINTMMLRTYKRAGETYIIDSGCRFRLVGTEVHVAFSHPFVMSMPHDDFAYLGMRADADTVVTPVTGPTYIGYTGALRKFMQPWETSIDSRTLEITWDLNMDEYNIQIPRGMQLHDTNHMEYIDRFIASVNAAEDTHISVNRGSRGQLLFEFSRLFRYLVLSRNLAEDLGFDVTGVDPVCVYGRGVDNFIYNSRPFKFTRVSPHVAFMYISIIRPTLIGGRYAQLLRVFELPKSREGDTSYVTHEFDIKQPAHLSSRLINEIDVKLLSHDGNKLYFTPDDVPTVFTLLFEKI